MKDVTGMLKEEHQLILKAIDVILNECEQLDGGQELEKSFFEKAIDFIKNYADKFHHAKEEDILFEKLNSDTVQMHCNPIPQMLYEHDTGRDFVKGMERGLEENDKKTVIENARGYAYLLKDHIMKEDNILYPMAEEALNDEQKDAILKEYNEVEVNKFPKADINKYISIIIDLEELNRRI
jgi:hemerythrin-like domain-containing protein